MASMTEIEVAAKQFSEARRALSTVCVELQAELNAVKAKHMDSVKGAVAEARAKHAVAAALVRASPSLFKKPRSVLFHGVKLGYEKAKGKIQIADVAKTIALIKKLFPSKQDVL